MRTRRSPDRRWIWLTTLGVAVIVAFAAVASNWAASGDAPTLTGKGSLSAPGTGRMKDAPDSPEIAAESGEGQPPKSRAGLAPTPSGGSPSDSRVSAQKPDKPKDKVKPPKEDTPEDPPVDPEDPPVDPERSSRRPRGPAGRPRGPAGT